jgi:rhodanese-related sulfurtransferase
MRMMWSLAAASIALACVAIFAFRRTRVQDQLQQHSITAAELHDLLASGQKVRLFDVRQPLDLLAHLEIIPGAQRIPPNEVLENPGLIPKNEAAIVYCTCPSDKTSREILRRVLALGFSRIRFLRGGLAAWKDNGYSVEPYQEVFHLNDAKVARYSG